MSRGKIIQIAIAVCAVILAGAVIITSTGALKDIGAYADAEKYTAGETDISGGIAGLDVHWTSGRVIIAYHGEDTVLLRETADRTLSEDEKMRWWMDGDTLRIQYAKSGIRLAMPEKVLTITLPEGTELKDVKIQTNSAGVEIPGMKAERLEVGSTSGSIIAAAEARTAAFSSTSGDLKIRMTGEAESIELGSTSGSIAAEADKAIQITAGTTSGGIRITAAESGSVKAGSTSGNIDLKLGKVRSLEANATSGSITAALPETPGFTAKVSLTSGSFESGIPLTKNGNQYVCGDGSARISIGTTSGDVRITAAEGD